MTSANERFTEAALAAVRGAIVDAGGNEVFLLGTLVDDRVGDVRVLARGNRHSAPAILQVPCPGEVVIHNHPGGRLVPSDADVEFNHVTRASFSCSSCIELHSSNSNTTSKRQHRE